MTFDNLADALDRYADDVTSVGMNFAAARFHDTATQIRDSPESVRLGYLYTQLTEDYRDSYLEDVGSQFGNDDDPEHKRTERNLRSGGREVAAAIRHTILSPEDDAAYQRLEEENAALPFFPDRSPAEKARWRQIVEEQKRLLDPIKDWGPPQARYAAPERPNRRRSTTSASSFTGFLWVVGITLVLWLILVLDSVWPF